EAGARQHRLARVGARVRRSPRQPRAPARGAQPESAGRAGRAAAGTPVDPRGRGVGRDGGHRPVRRARALARRGDRPRRVVSNARSDPSTGLSTGCGTTWVRMVGMTSVRWGVIGPGKIAAKVVQDFVHLPDAEVVAVASRSADRARAFADANGVERAYGSYREVIDDPDVDALYIATPHPQHLELGLAGVAAGKHLLVEKAFAATVAGAEELIVAARAAGVFCMEEMRARRQPLWVDGQRLLDDGAIGELRQLRAALGVAVDFVPSHRLFDPAQGGGALLDVGIYPLSLAHWLPGTPDQITVSGALTT